SVEKWCWKHQRLPIAPLIQENAILAPSLRTRFVTVQITYALHRASIELLIADDKRGTSHVYRHAFCSSSHGVLPMHLIPRVLTLAAILASSLGSIGSSLAA